MTSNNSHEAPRVPPGTKEKTKEKTKSEKLEGRVAELEAANFQLKEQLVDSMRGEIEARRKLEAVRDYVGQMLQMPTQEVERPEDANRLPS